MLVTSVVVAPVGYRTNPFRLAMIRLTMGEFRRGVSRSVRSSTKSNRALGDMHDRECEQGPQEQASAERLPTDDPPPHPATV